jgi:hypothetical protein
MCANKVTARLFFLLTTIEMPLDGLAAACGSDEIDPVVSAYFTFGGNGCNSLFFVLEN